jgi:hypothetical protein
MSLALDHDMARKWVELITGSADTPMLWRFISDREKQAPPLEARGSVSSEWARIEATNRAGYAVYAVVNEGTSYRDDDITVVRALFVDKDADKDRDRWLKVCGDERGAAVPWRDVEWHLSPDLIVSRSDFNWHAYWFVRGQSVTAFKYAQRRLAAHYGSDPSVCNPARVMRLPGTLHLKAEPALVRLRIPEHTKDRLSRVAALEDIL